VHWGQSACLDPGSLSASASALVQREGPLPRRQPGWGGERGGRPGGEGPQASSRRSQGRKHWTCWRGRQVKGRGKERGAAVHCRVPGEGAAHRGRAGQDAQKQQVQGLECVMLSGPPDPPGCPPVPAGLPLTAGDTCRDESPHRTAPTRPSSRPSRAVHVPPGRKKDGAFQEQHRGRLQGLPKESSTGGGSRASPRAAQGEAPRQPQEQHRGRLQGCGDVVPHQEQKGVAKSQAQRSRGGSAPASGLEFERPVTKWARARAPLALLRPRRPACAARSASKEPKSTERRHKRHRVHMFGGTRGAKCKSQSHTCRWCSVTAHPSPTQKDLARLP